MDKFLLLNKFTKLATPKSIFREEIWKHSVNGIINHNTSHEVNNHPKYIRSIQISFFLVAQCEISWSIKYRRLYLIRTTHGDSRKRYETNGSRVVFNRHDSRTCKPIRHAVFYQYETAHIHETYRQHPKSPVN